MLAFAFTLAVILSAALLLRPVQANAEKIIFTGPAPVDVLPPPPPLTATDTTLSNLNLLPTLRPNNTSSSMSLRTNLTRIFAPEHAQPAWFLLGDLAHAQRYELRVCWSALEPTSFTLDVYHPHVVWSTPALAASLSQYAATLRNPNEQLSPSSPPSSFKQHSSALLLRIQATADYFSHHKTLMQTPPPPVLVDLILDPYLYNVLPRSLLPTAAYLVGVAVVAWCLAQWIVGSLTSIAADFSSNDQKKNMKKKKQS